MVANINFTLTAPNIDNDYDELVERLTLASTRDRRRKVNHCQQRWQKYLLRRALRRRPHFVER